MEDRSERWSPSEDELRKILRRHEQWLESEGKEGERANLSEAHLRRADLSETNLQGADLSGAYSLRANLSETHLRRADLSEAVLRDADLADAKLRNADLSEAKLRGADLSGAVLRDANLSRAVLWDANLSGADLWGADLSGAKLRDAELSEANLFGVDLRGADLAGAVLRDADLSGARLWGADIKNTDLSRVNLEGAQLSKAVVDSGTLSRTSSLRNARKGVNGIWVASTDSAALMTVTPPGDSMQGRNANAIVQSLKHARRLHGISVGVAILGLSVLFVQFHSNSSVDWISLPFIDDLKFPVEQFALLGMSISVGLLSLVKSFMSDALTGARYLQSRNDAMTIGNFPWALSRYTGRKLDRWLQSLVTRFVLAYHPAAYVLFWEFPVPWYYWLLGGILMMFSTWIFAISQQFQRPIVFDRRTEENRKSDLEDLTEAVEKQTALTEQLVNSIRSEQQLGASADADPSDPENNDDE